MIKKSLILLNQTLKNKEAVFKLAAKQAFDQSLIDDQEKFLAALWQREAQLPTSVGKEIAMPHCQSASVLKPFVLFIRNEKPLFWTEYEKVDLIFLIAIPQKVSGQLHLKTIANLSRKLVHRDFVALLYSQDQDAIYSLLDETLMEV